MIETVQESVKMLLETEQFQKNAELVQISEISSKHRSFNDELVTAHYAIIPTKKPLPHDYQDLERKIYGLIATRFMANWMPPAVYLVREVELSDGNGHVFRKSEKVLQEKGFLMVFSDEIEEDTQNNFSIPELQLEQELEIKSAFLKEGQTRKPSYHTEDSILTFMETAGRNLIEDEELKELMKGKRIGTPATEETFILKLLQRGYISFDKGKIKTTSLGAAFIEAFPVDEIKDPSFTAEMEYHIQRIQAGELKYEQIVRHTNELAKKIVREVQGLEESTVKGIKDSRNEDIEITQCSCGGKILDKQKFYGCSNHPKCTVTIPKVIKGKTIPGKQIERLLSLGETELIKGFKKDENTSFDAIIVYKDGTLKFRFLTLEEMSLGPCPKCHKGLILKNKKGFYGCSGYKTGCDFSLPGEIKGKKLPEAQIKNLLKDRKTGFIQGFTGDKGEFTAAIAITEELKLQFVFPTKEDKSVGKCPLCKGNVVIGKSFYICENYKKSCDFILNPVLLEKKIPLQQIKKLLDKNMTDKINGFKSVKTGKEFSAKLSYDNKAKRLNLIFK